uniref:Putative secreted protein n=1 Tax=Anopheles darlingi TaxID=43151 RepID=A0A2M4DR29_ANODA
MADEIFSSFSLKIFLLILPVTGSTRHRTGRCFSSSFSTFSAISLSRNSMYAVVRSFLTTHSMKPNLRNFSNSFSSVTAMLRRITLIDFSVSKYVSLRPGNTCRHLLWKCLPLKALIASLACSRRAK